MIKFYVTQIKLGKIAINNVPLKWKNRVIEALGGDTNEESMG